QVLRAERADLLQRVVEHAAHIAQQPGAAAVGHDDQGVLGNPHTRVILLGVRAGVAYSRASSSSISLAAGRTRRATTAPSRSTTSVGHSLTWNDRPSGRPGPSSIFRCASSSRLARARCNAGWAAWQWPHQGA